MISIWRFTGQEQPNIVLFQEMMGTCDQIIFELRKPFMGRDFIGFHLEGLLGGIVTGISMNISIINFLKTSLMSSIKEFVEFIMLGETQPINY
jgi:hypothetical protein